MSGRRRWHDHDDEAVSVPAALDELPLFAAGARDWPQVPRAEAEPYVLPIEPTIAARYAAWRATRDGERVFGRFGAIALGELARGATRLSAKSIWEQVRRALRVPMNNDFHAPMVREMEALYPILRGQFEKRQRRAS